MVRIISYSRFLLAREFESRYVPKRNLPRRLRQYSYNDQSMVPPHKSYAVAPIFVRAGPRPLFSGDLQGSAWPEPLSLVCAGLR
jgi:hypothetical protein